MKIKCASAQFATGCVLLNRRAKSVLTGLHSTSLCVQCSLVHASFCNYHSFLVGRTISCEFSCMHLLIVFLAFCDWC
jgi:hypothetical protein